MNSWSDEYSFSIQECSALLVVNMSVLLPKSVSMLLLLTVENQAKKNCTSSEMT